MKHSLEDIRFAVLDIVREALPGASPDLDERTELLGLRDFSSLVIVKVVDGVERALGVEMDADRIVPETFLSVSTLARVIWAQILRGEETDAESASV